MDTFVEGGDSHTVVTAEVMKFASRLALSRTVVDSVKLYPEFDKGLRHLVYTITIGVLGKETKTEQYDDEVKTYPATIWEELKSVWPKWLRRRFPVRYTTEIRHRTVTHYHICPHLDYGNTDAAHIRWLQGVVDNRH